MEFALNNIRGIFMKKTHLILALIILSFSSACAGTWELKDKECHWAGKNDSKWYDTLKTTEYGNAMLQMLFVSLAANYETCKEGDVATFVFDVNNNNVDVYLSEPLVINDALLGKDIKGNETRNYILKRIKGYDITFKPSEENLAKFEGKCAIDIKTTNFTMTGFSFEGFNNGTAVCYPEKEEDKETVIIDEVEFKNNKQDTNDESKQKCEIGEYWNATTKACVAKCFKWQVPDEDQMLCVDEEGLVFTDGDIYPDKYDLCPDKDNDDLNKDGYADACDAGSNSSSNVPGAGIGGDDGGCALIKGNVVPNLSLSILLIPFAVFLVRRFHIN
jgi:hypothetical protein